LNPGDYWWVIPTATIVGAFAGGGSVAWLTNWLTSRREKAESLRRKRAHWAALRAEIIVCGEQAIDYLPTAVLAPSSRLPMTAFENSLPELLGAGAVSEHDYRTIAQFYIDARSFNFGLDLAQDFLGGAIGPPWPAPLIREVQRLVLKASHIVPSGPGGNRTEYDRALAVADDNLRALDHPGE